MRTIKGPAVFLAQFMAPEPPFDRLETIADWAAGMGYEGVQMPTFNPAIFDVEKAADSQDYCDEIKGLLAERGLVITELSTHRQGHLVAVHPAYDLTVDAFAPKAVRGNPAARTAWAREQVLCAAKASARLGLDRHASFPGSLLWPYLYLYPPRPEGLVKAGFKELASRWRPLLDAFDEAGVDLCFEIHPGEDLHDGLTFEMFLDAIDHHPRCNLLYDPSHIYLQMIDYIDFLDIYQERVKIAHIKDAEFKKNGRTGFWGGYQNWPTRAGRFRSLGDGDIDFGAVFSKLAEIDYDGWAVVEWECCIKDPHDGAREGAAFVRDHMIKVQPRAFDVNMQEKGVDTQLHQAILGLDRQ